MEHNEYITEFRIDENDFKEFSAVNYRHSMRVSLYILLLYIIYNIYYALRFGFLPQNLTFHLGCIIFAVLVFFLNSSRLKNAASKEVKHWQKPFKEYVITFREHITVNRDGTEKRYAYNTVKKLFKTGSLYCLYLHQKSYIIVKPDAASDFPEFIFSKCEKMSSKRVTDLEQIKKANKIIFYATLALMLLGLIFAVIL